MCEECEGVDVSICECGEKVGERDMSLWGAHFGYPQCCIDEFIAWCDASDLLLPYGIEILAVRAPRKLVGSGYVPCAACNFAFTEEALLARINEARKCSIPFWVERRGDGYAYHLRAETAASDG